MDSSILFALRRFTGSALIAIAALGPIGCSLGQKADAVKSPQGMPPVPVTTTKVTQQTVPITVQAIGTVEPYSTVQMKAMVAGQLQKVHFTEGDLVKKGQLLFTIDASPYDAALKQAEAALARDQAQLENARVEAQRAATMVREGILERQQYDQTKTSAAVFEATVAADRAAIERVKVDMGYTVIRAPLEGRTGDLMVHEGNLVKANDIPLVTINQLSPVYVRFSVSERRLAIIRRYAVEASLKAQVAPPDDKQAPSEGELTFVNNEVDRTTGTVQLKATFPNEDHRLWPGQFVQVILTLSSRPNATVVPAKAVQAGQQGQFVFVVKADNTVESRTVDVSDTVDGHLVVEKGLEPGETVVTEGQLRLAPGAKVALKESSSAAGESKS